MYTHRIRWETTQQYLIVMRKLVDLFVQDRILYKIDQLDHTFYVDSVPAELEGLCYQLYLEIEPLTNYERKQLAS